MHAFHRRPLALLVLLGGVGCASAPPPPSARPTPSSNVAPATTLARATTLTTQWQGLAILERRDSLVLTLPDGSSQLQRLGRLAHFTIAINGVAFTVRLDSLQLAPASPETAKGAIGTTWSGRLGAFGRIESLTPSQGGLLVEELTTTVASLLPTLPRGGVHAGERWADTTRRVIRVEVFRTDDRRLARWQANPATEIEGLRLIPILVREDFEQIGRGASAGREMTMTAQGSRSGVYYLTADGRIERALMRDSIAKLITVPGSKQSIPTMQYSLTLVRYLPLPGRAPNE